MEQIELIDAGLIMSSPLNPRKVVDQNSIIELSESIKSVGLLQPITLRKTDKTLGTDFYYELVLGSRRLAAMKLLEWNSIPCIVKELDDDEVLEAMIIENLQRKDIEPLDEAIAFKMLYDKGIGYVDIAAKVGKSPLFVKLRITLNDLADGFKLMLSEGRLTLSHAFELCKVNDEIQTAIYEQHYSDHGTAEQDWSKLSLPELREKLSKQFLSLDAAGFDKHECIGCKYNTTQSDSLFSEYHENNCTNISCYQTKKQEHIIGVIKEHIANDVPIMVKASAEKMIAQLKELGVEEPILYLSANYDLAFYPETDDEEETNLFDQQSIQFGYTRAYTVGMIKEACKYVYFKAKEKSEPIVPVEEKVSEIKANAVIEDAKKDELNEIEKLQKKDKRNIELKDEKIIEDTRKMFIDSKYCSNESSFSENESNAFLACILYLCNNPKVREITKRFDPKLSFVQNVESITIEEKNLIKRSYIKQLITSATVTGSKEVQSILGSLSNEYYGAATDKIVEQYDNKYIEQHKRIDARIAVINGEVEPAKKREPKVKDAK